MPIFLVAEVEGGVASSILCEIASSQCDVTLSA